MSDNPTSGPEPCPCCGALPCDQANAPRVSYGPAEIIAWIAKVAEAIGWQAGVGGSETAGTIISVLAANPHMAEAFMSRGAGLFIDGPIHLDAVNGCLTYLSQGGEILSPGELHRRRQGLMQ